MGYTGEERRQHEYCEKHIELAEDIAVIKNSLQNIAERICKHIEEGEKTGGIRDKVFVNENEIRRIEQMVKENKKSVWLSGIIGGVIGGLLAKSSPEFFSLLSKVITR